MFRMYGNIVQILKYQSTSEELTFNPDSPEKPVTITVTHYTPTEEEAEALGTDVQPLPLESDAWMDGLEVPDVPDTMAEAIKIRDMGEATYKAKLKREEAQNPE